MEILILSENIHIDREQICIAASQLAYRKNYNFKVVYKKFNNKILKFIDRFLCKFFIYKDITDINKRILNAMEENDFDLIIAIKPTVIKLKKIRKLLDTKNKYKNKKVKIITYSYDNMLKTHNLSKKYFNNLRWSDKIITSKETNYAKLACITGSKCIKTNHFYTIKPIKSEIWKNVNEIYQKKNKEWSVLSIGTYEKQRKEWLEELFNLDIKILIGGNGWKNKYNNLKQYKADIKILDSDVSHDEYIVYMQKALISICFYRNKNDDQENSRYYEISSSGSTMIECLENNDPINQKKDQIKLENNFKETCHNKLELVKTVKRLLDNEIYMTKLAYDSYTKFSLYEKSASYFLENIIKLS